MSDRLKLANALGAGSFAASFASVARQAGKVFRIGHLSGGGEAPSKPSVDAFREVMRALGYVEAKNFVLEKRYAEGKGERLPALTQELIQRNLDAANFKAILDKGFNLSVSHDSHTLAITKRLAQVCRAIKATPGTVGSIISIFACAGRSGHVYYQELFVPPNARRLQVSDTFGHES